MSKKSMLLALGALITAVGIGLAVIFSSPTQIGQSDQAKTPSSQSSLPTTPQTGLSKGAYVNYSSNIIANTKGTKILFFYAPWCPQCRQLDASIKKGPIPDGVTIIKIDYDSSQTLRQQYGVTIQTSLVKLDDQGKVLKHYVAYDSPTLESLQRNLLQ